MFIPQLFLVLQMYMFLYRLQLQDIFIFKSLSSDLFKAIDFTCLHSQKIMMCQTYTDITNVNLNKMPSSIHSTKSHKRYEKLINLLFYLSLTWELKEFCCYITWLSFYDFFEWEKLLYYYFFYYLGSGINHLLESSSVWRLFVKNEKKLLTTLLA